MVSQGGWPASSQAGRSDMAIEHTYPRALAGLLLWITSCGTFGCVQVSGTWPDGGLDLFGDAVPEQGTEGIGSTASDAGLGVVALDPGDASVSEDLDAAMGAGKAVPQLPSKDGGLRSELDAGDRRIHCEADIDCPAEAPQCEADGVCDWCLNHEDCALRSDGKTLCNGNPGATTFGQCVECATRVHCPDAAPRCSVDGQCEPCTSDRDCLGVHAPGTCQRDPGLPSFGQCLECSSDAGCSVGETP